ncbi:MAG TPA: GntR family transcriptional regulator [Lachnospiraceae bacterium]|jgi:DNA-binding transcriptional regulator YhcF (GntR family)|nr:GntR family transcriptional regulator [Lachnospiraceae bacterium]HEX3078505.1 GntR family transcriptional regulator [Lachnospiraceae bacterium]
MEFDNNVPIYLQVIKEIKQDLIQGNLLLGDKMLSTRDLALKYQINPNTAGRIYRELEQEGICYTRRGLGTFVTDDTTILRKIQEDMASESIDSFLLTMRKLGFSKEELLRIINDKY